MIKLNVASGDVDIEYTWKTGGGDESYAWRGAFANFGHGELQFQDDIKGWTDPDEIVEALLRRWIEGFERMEAGDE